jgi:hypothetical protein
MAAASADGIDFLGDDISAKGRHYPMVVLTNKKLLADDQFSDVLIYVGSDKVPAHSAILACRCEELVPMPNESDKKKKPVKPKRDVKVKGIPNEQIMRRVLEFLYTGRVEFPKLPTLEILQLNAAARHFKLNRLGYLCERWLREHMCMDNVFHLLKGSVDAGESRVKAFCLQYALDHYTEFIANKDGIHILGIDLFQEVVKAFTDRPPAPEEIPADKAPADTLIEDFQKLYERMPYSDVVFNVQGTQIKCHKAILAAHSDAFTPLVLNAPATGVDFSALSALAFTSMLKFLYYGDDNIDPHPATELVGFSKQFKLNSLLGICEDKCRTSVSSETVLDILATTYIPEMEEKPELVAELKKKTFPFILANLTEIDLTPIRKLHPNIAIDILTEIQKSWDCLPTDGGSGGGGGDYSASSTSTSTSTSTTSTAGAGGSFALGSQRAAAPPPPARDEERPPPPPPRSVPPPSIGAPSFPPPVATTDAGDARPPPPPPRDGSAPPPTLQAPPPSLGAGGPPPPPLRGDPPPPIGMPSTAPPPPPIGEETPPETPKGKGEKVGKKASTGAVKKDGDKKKKEDEKKKKEEEKRIAKEKKEREKMEKKGKSSKPKAPPS